MDISRKVARLIFPHFRFGESKLEEAIKLVNLGVGGFCLYGGEVEEVINVIRILKDKSDHPLIFCADYENGVGQWVKGATRLPTNMAIAATGEPSLARRKAEITAIESDALGVDWVLAPVLDLADNHLNPIVNLRAFSDNPQTVTDFAKEFISGLNSFNIINCIKHFPGHGNTSIDSHIQLPVIEKDFSEIENKELIPFKNLSDISDSIMVGHLLVKNIDNNFPASLSKNVISTIETKLNFNKVIITDALMMKAIKNETEAGILAFLAGADILLYPEDPYRLFNAMIDAINKGIITVERLEKSIRKIEKLISKRRISSYRPKDITSIGLIQHRKFIMDVAEKCITFIKDDGSNIGKKIYLHNISNNDFDAQVFIQRLKELDFIITDSPQTAHTSIIISLSKPKAFSGKINITEEDKKTIDEIITVSKKTVFVSFGSPFVLDGYIKRLNKAVCCFDDFAEFQRTLAECLSEIRIPQGKMPVKIDE